MGASWSPDGKEIAFVHGLDPFQNPEVFGFHSTLYDEFRRQQLPSPARAFV